MVAQKPSLDVDYRLVSAVYLVGSAIFVLLYVFIEGRDDNSAFQKSLQGSYVIFAPFLPCFLWSLIVLYNQRQAGEIDKKKQ
jgi:hypothetical protein